MPKSNSSRLETLENALASTNAAINQLIALHSQGKAVSLSPPTNSADNANREAPSESAENAASRSVQSDSIVRANDVAFDEATGNAGYPAYKPLAAGKKESERKQYPVKPADRRRFMEQSTKGVEFVPCIDMIVRDKAGQEKRVKCTPTSGQLEPKAYSTGNHGLYAQTVAYTLTMPDGTEWSLSGAVTLMLTKRRA